ncbi:MAG: biotin-dependent carboxyltransferase family protein [Bacteroidetes bacterium]|nr:biotin-dependent carboxyltransferase family protein [Bacteroidota bacterium]
MFIQIIKAGILDTIQDAGRYGYQHLGINPGGAMDRYAMRIANLLTGNDPDEALIEMHFPAPVFLFHEPGLLAIAGADFSPSINGEPIPILHPVIVQKNDVLQFHRPVKGTRAYMSFRGGLELTSWLGSHSTHLKAEAGGYQGRALQKGDQLSFRQKATAALSSASATQRVLPWWADTVFDDSSDDRIAVLPGQEWNELTTDSKELFTEKPFIITKQSDRMGYRLLNDPLFCKQPMEMISSAVCFGTLQLLPEGKLILLMADHQTTGGYPRIAHVISAHHSRLAQSTAGDALHFRFTDMVEAEHLQIKQQQHLSQLQNACTFRLEAFLKS